MSEDRTFIIPEVIKRIFSGSSSSSSALMALIGIFLIYLGVSFSKENTLVLLMSGALSLYLFAISAKIYFSDVKVPDVIPPQDRDFLVEIIKSNGKDGLDTYIKLSSLYGFTGSITKLGLTGLPLLTVALTVFFTCLASLLYYSDAETSVKITDNLMDLAKLTLGAFIGSFVQKNVSAATTALDQSTKTASSLAATATALNKQITP